MICHTNRKVTCGAEREGGDGEGEERGMKKVVGREEKVKHEGVETQQERFVGSLRGAEI